MGLGVVVSVLLLAGPGTAGVLAQADAVEAGASIRVAGAGHVDVEPDQATLNLGVTVRGRTAVQASSAAALAMAEVIASLEASGIAAADIQTTRIDLDRVTRRDPESGLRVPAGWLVQNRVRATTDEIDRTGEIIDAAIAAGATDVDSIRFSASDPSSAVAEARAEAVEAAALSASQLASAAGVQVGDVLSITEGSAASEFGRFRLQGYGGDTAGGPTPVMPGVVSIDVDVYIEYAIE
jgi:uncharacterized protein YggE